ncbi:MAG: 4Fe-4S dicluster domain-containing protein [Candidatus Anammoxibacter sp.]
MDAYKITICKREKGCKNAVYKGTEIVDDIVSIFQAINYTDFIRGQIKGPVKSHHQFKITISCCPNSCPMPQIADIGIVAASTVTVSSEPCSNCKSCVDTCIENAIMLDEINGPAIDHERCVYCAKCADNCPTETIIIKESGFRLMIGGKLGRHARLASELTGIFQKQEALTIVKNSLEYFKENYLMVNRFADLFSIYAENEIYKRIAYFAPFRNAQI